MGEPDEEPHRPWLTIVVGTPGGLVLGTAMAADKPSPDEVLSVIEHTMASPLAGQPRRPSRIVWPEPELAEALGSRLESQGVACTLGETSELREAVASLEEHLQGGPLLPGLLDSPEVTPEQVGRLFAAAAHYYREAPWRLLSDEHPIAMRLPAESARARYAVVMGGAGLEFGLAFYRSPKHLAAMYSGVPPEALIGAFEQESITYGKPQDLAFSDLEALEHYGWEVAGPNAYPLPLVFTKQREVKRPGAGDLRWYEAGLRAIPRFVGEHLKPEHGLVRPAEATLSVPVGEGEVAVNLRYPPDRGERALWRRRRR